MFLVLLAVGWCLAMISGDETDPEQVHINLGSVDGEMIITWSTLKRTDNSLVQYGMAPDNFTHEIRAVHSHFIQNETNFHTYRAVLQGLEPAKVYYYRVGTKHKPSEIFHFSTLKTGVDWLPRLAVFGDMGFLNDQSRPYLEKDVQNRLYDALIHIGDMGYDIHEENGFRGHNFMRQIQSIAAKVAYQVIPGNHERYDNFSHYDARFSMLGDSHDPKPHELISKRINNHFYSLNIGPAHILLISTEFYYYSGEEQMERQYRFIEEDLKRANVEREKRPWLIVMGHRSIYCAKQEEKTCDKNWERPSLRKGHFSKSTQKFKFGLETLFYQQGVDLQIYGHEHFFVRFLPLYNRTILATGTGKNDSYKDPSGPVQYITGSAGCWEMHPIFAYNLKPWVAKAFYDYGYTKMTWKTRNHLEIVQISADKNGSSIDRVDFVKTTPKPKWMP